MSNCAFTGHRPEKFPWRTNESDPACIALKAALADQIEYLADRGCLTFLSGMARGVDQWAASAVLTLRERNPGIRLHCILPCDSQADQWSGIDRKTYQAILSRADLVEYVNHAYTKNCMLARNRYMVDHVSVVLAVYNGESRGGTAHTVRYARKRKRELLIMNPLTRIITRENGDKDEASSRMV